MFSNSTQGCICGRSFDDSGAFTRHKKTCRKGKKHLAIALRQVKDTHLHKKRHVEGTFSEEFSMESLGPNSVQADGTPVVHGSRLAQMTGLCRRDQ